MIDEDAVVSDHRSERAIGTDVQTGRLVEKWDKHAIRRFH